VDDSSAADLSIALTAGAISSFIVTPAELLMISQQRFGGSLASTTATIVQKTGSVAAVFCLHCAIFTDAFLFISD
jgi:hypothetical protein